MALPPGMVLPPPGGPGAPPPGLGGGTGPAAAPSHMVGSLQQGMTAVKVGMEALQKALQQLPLGSDLHTAVLKALTDVGKHLEKGGAGEGDPSAVLQQLVEGMRGAKMNP